MDVTKSMDIEGRERKKSVAGRQNFSLISQRETGNDEVRRVKSLNLCSAESNKTQTKIFSVHLVPDSSRSDHIHLTS